MKIYSLMLTKLKESFTLNIKPTHATAQQILTAEYAWPKKTYDRAEHNLERQVDNTATKNQTCKMSYMDGYDLWY